MASMGQPQAITKVSISAVVIALPILYVSLLRLPPSTLAGDTTFWFLMSNSIIAIIAADSGMLFFSSATSHDGDRPSGAVPGDDKPAVDVVQEDFCDAMSPVLPSLITSDELPAAVNIIPDVMGGEQLPTDMEDHAPPAFVRGEDDGANKPNTEMDHALLHRCGGEAAVLALEQNTNENYAMIVVKEEVGVVASDPKKLLVEDRMLIRPPPACEGGDYVADELAITNCEHAFTETEPWRRPELVTNESLDEAAAEEDDQWPISHPCATPDHDVPEDRMIKRKETETEGSRPPEEPEYWQLSDEELNRKVEEFIMRFNRNMIEQEAGV